MSNGVTYDTGALIAADRNNRTMWAPHASFLAAGIAPTVPAPVLAEARRGGARQANLARFLSLCNIECLTENQAKAVGVLGGKSGHDNIVDITVVEGAIRRSDAVITSNPTHITMVADSVKTRPRIKTV
jgi:hypothetical protein